MRAASVAGLLSLAVVLAFAQPAWAQAEPPVGARAAGMGGAFTAVADDASSVFWNPAGLAGGSFFSLVLDRNTMDQDSATLIALGTPPLGVAYYRTATADLPNRRNSLVAHHAGVTLLQSLGERVAVGATVKMVRGVATSGAASRSSTKFDTDLGVMTTGSLVRVGLSVRNLMAPAFAVPGGGVVKLDRRVRAGISVNTARRTTAAADFDLTTVDTARGAWREAAVGVETNPLVRKAWIRGGLRWNTADGPAAPVGTAGASVAVYGSTLADVHVSVGSDHGNRGWGAGLRFVF